jgi:hypothetical protein
MKTWTKGKVCGLEIFCRKKNRYPGFVSSHLDTMLTSSMLSSRASLNSLFDHSHNLLLELSQERRDNAVSFSIILENRVNFKPDQRDRPIIFVVHSLGGIVVKDVCISTISVRLPLSMSYFCRRSESENVRTTHSHLSHIISSTRGIISSARLTEEAVWLHWRK